MDFSEVLTIVVPLVALAIVAYSLVRSGKTITLHEVQNAYQQGESLANELREVGLMAVSSVEQLKKNGVINTNEEAFQEAFDYINSWPGLEKLDRNIIAKAVEGSYQMYQQMKKDE